MIEGGAAERPQHDRVGREDQGEAQQDGALAHPRRLVLQLVQPPSAGEEPREHPVGQPEDPQFLGRGRVHGQPVGVVGVPLRQPDLRGVAVPPDRALAQQPVRAEPAAGQHRRRPPGEAEQHARLGEARDELDEAGGDEVHRDRQRRPRHSPVEVPRHLEVRGQGGVLQVTNARRGGARRGQQVIQPGRRPVTEVARHRGVQRAEHLHADEHHGDREQRRHDAGTALDRGDKHASGDREAGGQQAARDEQSPPGRRQPPVGVPQRRGKAHLLPFPHPYEHGGPGVRVACHGLHTCRTGGPCPASISTEVR